MKRAVTAWALAVVLPASAASAAAQGSGGSEGAKRSVDIAVTRVMVDANGARIGAPSETIRYRLTQTKSDKGWRTTLTLGSKGTPETAAVNPFAGGRVELDESGNFSMFDNAGRPVDIPDRSRPPALQALATEWSGWPDAFIARPQNRQARLSEIEQRYGASSGRVGGLSRFLREQGEDVEELLVDSESGLPMQLNIARGGALQTQITFEYTRQAGGAMVRRGMRSETIVDKEGHRAITSTEFSNLIVEQER